MGRHAAVFIVLLSLVAAGCGDAGEDSTSSTTLEPGADVDEFGCRSIQSPTPVLLEVGVVFEHSDNGTNHEVCASGYDTAVPTSGTHFSVWQNCGFYTAPIRDYGAVHALEHGAVWIAYQPDLISDDVRAIESAVAEETHLIAAPYPGLENSIVLSAWTRQLAVDRWSDPLVDEFLADFVGRLSTTAPEAGVRCSDGFGVAPDQPDAGYGAALEFARSD